MHFVGFFVLHQGKELVKMACELKQLSSEMMCSPPVCGFACEKDVNLAMVSSADDLALWKDFPKGLGVLLCDEDSESAADTKIKLEAMNYIVYAYCKEEALEAILRKAENYHIAIVEVTADNSFAIFKFLEMVDIPTIVISKLHCLNTVMKCIALGAAEFLQKPLSEEKLENIWQHVVHKAFNTGGYANSRSLKPFKATVKSLPKFQSQTNELKFEIPSQTLDMEQAHKIDNAKENVKFSAPSTPQLIKRERCKENESINYKFVDNFLNNITGPMNSEEVYLPSKPEEITTDEELNSAEGSKVDECSSAREVTLNAESQDSDSKSRKKKPFVHGSSCLNSRKGNRRKMKIDWTQDLHRDFVQAVEKLGIDQAIPSKILELMKVEGLTRHNVASHLQKFRMHRKHILPKEDDIRWYRDSSQKDYMKKPIMAFSPYPSNYPIAARQVYPMWPPQTFQLPNVQMWRYPGIPTWYPSDNWQSMNSEIHADAWGFPILPHYSYGQHYMPPQGPMINSRIDASVTAEGGILSKSSYDVCPSDDVIDDMLKEAMSKPWLPLPLGLKPPSPEKIIAELHLRGIQAIPPLPRLSRS